MVRVAWERAETEMLVKCFGLVVFGVNCERTDAGDIGGLQRSLHGILEQAGSEAFALPRGRNRQAGKEHDGNRMTGEALRQALRSGGILDLTEDERVVADYRLIRKGNVGLRGSRLLVLERITREKKVQRFPAAIELADIVTT